MKLIITESQEQQITFDALVKKRDLKGIAKYLQQRIPFLKAGYNVFFNERNLSVQFQKQLEVHDKVVKIEDDLVRMINGLLTIDFNFAIFEHNGEEYCKFYLNPFFHNELDVQDQLLKHIYTIAKNMQIEKLKVSRRYPETPLDQIFKDLNGAFFKLEHFFDENYETEI